MSKENRQNTNIYSEVNLPEFNAIDKKIADNGDILYILKPKNRPRICPSCKKTSVYIHKTATRKVQDLDMFGHRVGLLVKGNTYKCNDCGYLINPSYESLNGRMTQRLVNAITEESFEYTFADVARRYHITATTVATLFNAKADVLMSEYKFIAPTVLGIDEVHLEDEYRGVFVHVDKYEGEVLEFTEKRTYPAVVETLRSMESPENLQLVTMDMWKAYKSAVRTVFPNMPIVIDHFHVIKALTASMDSVRASMCKKIKDDNGRKALKHNRMLLLANSEDLSVKQGKALNAIFEAYPVFEPLYTMKEAFRDIYTTANSSKEAKEMFEEWVQACENSNIIAYNDFIKTVRDWSDEIFAYFDFPNLARTNAQTESMNRCIRDIARQGRGYSFSVLRKKIILKKYVFKPQDKFSFRAFDEKQINK